MPSGRQIPPRPTARALQLALAVLALVLSASPARAGWLIDAARYHVGVHGQLSCQDCHSGAAREKPHPDPARLARPRAAAAVDCASCHPAVAEGLAAGRHGALRVTDPARYADCSACHNPHYQPWRGADKSGTFRQGRPRSQQCGACHEARDALPAPADGEAACFACHVAAPGPEGAAAAQQALCGSCHGEDAPAGAVRLDALAWEGNPHAALACDACHAGAARYPHSRVPTARCTACHARHDEKTAGGDLHARISCAACHLAGALPERVRPGGPVTARPMAVAGVSAVHGLLAAGSRDSCRRCHRPGNGLGASALVLPPKGVLCMPCHTATWSLGGWPSRVGLAVFALGLLGALAVWLTGSVPGASGGALTRLGAALGHAGRALFSRRLGPMLRALVLDGLLQRRLWAVSPTRGLIHNLIFLPFLLRLAWGLATLVVNSAWPDCLLGRALADKNHPATALFFDLTGLMVLAGVAAAIARRVAERGRRLPGLPGPDWPALYLLAATVVLGFVTEAARIALTGFPDGAGFAFIGRALGGLFSGAAGLERIFSYLWYAHAVAWAAFAAYLPSSRMFHIILAPLVLAMRAADDHTGGGHQPGR